MSTRLRVGSEQVEGAVEVRNWVADGIGKAAIDYADVFGKNLKDGGLTTSQIRNVFGEVRRIEMKGYSENETAFLLLKPKLAYAVGRAAKKEREGIKDLRLVLAEAIDAVVGGQTQEEKEGRFQNFVDFFESILAYHKAHGGD